MEKSPRDPGDSRIQRRRSHRPLPKGDCERANEGQEHGAQKESPMSLSSEGRAKIEHAPNRSEPRPFSNPDSPISIVPSGYENVEREEHEPQRKGMFQPCQGSRSPHSQRVDSMGCSE